MSILRALAGALAIAFACYGAAQAQTKSVSWQQVVVTPNSSAYSAGQCVGGVLTVPAMVLPQGPGGTVLGAVTLTDPQHQTAANDAMTLLIFNKAPTGTYTDHANCNVAAADAPNLMAELAVVAADCVQDQAPSTTICTLIPSAGLPLNVPMPVTNPNLYVVPIVAATPDWGPSASLYFNFMAMPFAF